MTNSYTPAAPAATNDTGKPFCRDEADGDGKTSPVIHWGGLTKREYAAIHLMAAMVKEEGTWDTIASRAVKIADLLFEKLDGK